MVVTKNIELPTEEELTTNEVNLSSAALMAGAFHLGKKCESENNEFMLCRDELNDPRKCISEGKAVTSCAMNFFRQVKKSCAEEFMQYANCLDKSSGDYNYKYCRKTQAVFDKCMKDNFDMERPEYGYFCRAKIHDSPRPKPDPIAKPKFEDPTPGLPEDYPKQEAKYGARFHIWR